LKGIVTKLIQNISTSKKEKMF